ncbi:RNA-binding ATPase activator esf2 [Quaeritorhiza haematococci]|nr:RNA-binding ATPase activator esf2 [Quaeritorhiza haematococci]
MKPKPSSRAKSSTAAVVQPSANKKNQKKNTQKSDELLANEALVERDVRESLDGQEEVVDSDEVADAMVEEEKKEVVDSRFDMGAEFEEDEDEDVGEEGEDGNGEDGGSGSVDARFALTADFEGGDSGDDDEQDEEADEEVDEDDDKEDSSATFIANDIYIGDDLAHSESTKQARPLTAESLAKFKDRVDKTGVIYLSRIPPFMKPLVLRRLLSRYGELGRIYLVPEDPKITARRKKYKGNKRQNYTEGWVEFMDKKVARAVATMLNAQKIGGKKRSYYHDDLWNMKYLPRFRWGHLTEQMAYERAVRDQKLRAEMNQAKRENSFYLKNVEKAKMIAAIGEKRKKRSLAGPASSTTAVENEDGAAERKAKKAKTDNTSTSSAPSSTTEPTSTSDSMKTMRRYKQRKVIDPDTRSRSAAPTGKTAEEKKASILSKIFAKRT